jgi:hypothetical protein
MKTVNISGIFVFLHITRRRPSLLWMLLASEPKILVDILRGQIGIYIH